VRANVTVERNAHLPEEETRHEHGQRHDHHARARVELRQAPHGEMAVERGEGGRLVGRVCGHGRRGL
jgi:hypothetical protein